MPDILEMLTAERDKLNRAIEALGGQVGSAIIRMTKTGRKRHVSAAARAKMAAAQRARWAKVKGTAAPASSPTAPKKKYTLSPAARANIAAGARKRWAKIKAEK
jgi:hypothetical protein